MLQVSGYRPPKVSDFYTYWKLQLTYTLILQDIYSSSGSMHIPPLSASRSSARLVAPSTIMMNYILHSGGKTQVCTSDPWKLTMKRQVAPPCTISLSASRSSAHLVAPSTIMMNYILRSGGKTQARTSDPWKLTGCTSLHHIFIGEPLVCLSHGTVDNYDELYPLQRWKDPSVYIRSSEAEDEEGLHHPAPPLPPIHPTFYCAPLTISLTLSFAIQSLLDLPVVNLRPSYFLYSKI
jgi:hypothetical protein